MPSRPGYRPMGCLLLVSCHPGDGQRHSQEVEDSPHVVIPGEGPEEFHHGGQVLLSTRQRKDKRSEGHHQSHPEPLVTPYPPPSRALGPFCPGHTSLAAGSWPGLGLGALGESAPWGRLTYQRSMVEPFFLFPRGYSSRQMSTPATLP